MPLPNELPSARRSLPSIFDGLPPGAIDFAALHARMERDCEARCLAALDRAIARLAAPALPPVPPAGTHDRPPDPPDGPLPG